MQPYQPRHTSVQPHQPVRPHVIVVTGLAGAGKTVALRALEDEGFYCVDNLPVTLIKPFTSIISSNASFTQVCIGIDIREKDFFPQLGSVLTYLREHSRLDIVFLESDKGTLLRRYKETRRPHPLSSPEIPIEEAIDQEAALLQPLRNEATRIVDTSSYTPHQLRSLIASLYRTTGDGAPLTITVMSFGFKYGVPLGADLVFDVRFLPNPHFVPELRPLTGIDAPVSTFVLSREETREFIVKTADLLSFLIPRYISEGKAYLTVCFGCTGGRHRSPAIAQHIADLIRTGTTDISVVHRDIDL